ncbi:hypothetical protein LWI28_027840 [Acer negundo]|uniref:Uncharacterized protein n=1 Tax=Acer negundo TaxID=4023 RepID=A0AAD5NP67_ACENE|nr:hypothetical protein LWI28_027840 [Acer negundo]
MACDQAWRPEKNPLDLNNLPEDYSRDGSKLVFDQETSSASGYRKKKSGAKDGKGDESGKVYECSCHPITPGSYIADPFRSVYPPRIFSGSPSSNLIPPPQPPSQPPQQPYPYPSPSRPTSSYPSHQYPPPPHHMNDCYVGHVLSSSSTYPPHQHQNINYMGGGAPESNYTCIGAPVGHGFVPGSSRGSSDLAGSSSGGGGDSSMINRFQDGF